MVSGKGSKAKRKALQAQKAATLAKKDAAAPPAKATPPSVPEASKRPARSSSTTRSTRSKPSVRPAAVPAVPRTTRPVTAHRQSPKRSEASAPVVGPALPLTRRDVAWATVTAALSAILFATILTGHPGMGDAPETIAGVSTLGVLHAPGYPAYVIAARTFSIILPFGSPALAVNLFSLVCAAASVGSVQLLARRCGADRWAASLGALVLAVGAGFWFYAGFAKHDMFSGLLFVVALHVLLAWQARPSTRRLVATSLVCAIGLGSSWPLTVVLVPAVAMVLVVNRRQLAWRPLATALAVGAAAVVALYGFVIVRATADPAVNWGRVTSVSRLERLITRTDFTRVGAPGVEATPSARATTPSGRIATAHTSGLLGGYFGMFLRELGVAGMALAVWGLVASFRDRRRTTSVAIAVVFASNLLAVLTQLGTSPSSSYDTILIEEGFLLGCLFALACWVAIGATDVVARVARRLEEPAAPSRGRIVVPAATAVIAAAVLVPPAIAHWPVAHRAGAPVADRYATTVLASLPRHAAFFVKNAELAQPLRYRQIVYHERLDVDVFFTDGLSTDWYREQVAKELGRPLPPRNGFNDVDSAGVVRTAAKDRRVFLDPQAGQLLKTEVGYRLTGLYYALVPGKGPKPVRSPAAVERTLDGAERTLGVPDARLLQWPNALLTKATYIIAALELSRNYFEANDVPSLQRTLHKVLTIDPNDKNARRNLAVLEG